MNDPASTNSEASYWQFNPRTLLKREWPYLLVLVLALFGLLTPASPVRRWRSIG
jgi:hypothetical protein